ncbi:MAG TPA: NAD-dependent succinate-semialdehyde dehydrogenase [Polyangia bacterium]|nr:NAD-dependent succinate-semialdehyde dehydrogenase [Polyangia bacterium]
MSIVSMNPATAETLRTFNPMAQAEVEQRLDRAAAAFRRWRARPVGERAAIVGRAGQILDKEKASFAKLMTREMGKLLTAAEQEAGKCARGCQYYAEHGERLLAPEIVARDGGEPGRDMIVFQPLGPVLAIMPWNFPFWQVIRFAAPGLVAGNVGILKHASNVPQCALALEDLFARAGAPEGVFQTLLVGSDRVADLIADDRVAAVTLTGSEGAGSAIAAAAGKHVKKTVLELGGSDPFIVMPSANMEKAVGSAVRARTINNGQSCIAAKRFIVAASVYDQFAPRFVAAMAALRVGDPSAPETQVGPLATPGILDGLDDQVKRSVKAGARVLTGGRRLDGPGNYYAPTVLADVPLDSPAAEDELFGPVAALFRVPDLDAAIQLANATRFGLGSSAWTADAQEVERFVRDLEAGCVFINGVVASEPNLPFGGIKHSGYGRELGVFGLREFTNIKTVRTFDP